VQGVKKLCRLPDSEMQQLVSLRTFCEFDGWLPGELENVDDRFSVIEFS